MAWDGVIIEGRVRGWRWLGDCWCGCNSPIDRTDFMHLNTDGAVAALIKLMLAQPRNVSCCGRLATASRKRVMGLGWLRPILLSETMMDSRDSTFHGVWVWDCGGAMW